MGHTDSVNSVAFSPDGKLILSAGFDGARLWDTETGQQALQWSDGAVLFRVVFSPDGKYIATARGGGSPDGAALWDANTGKILRRFTGTPAISSVAFSPDGEHILTGSDDGTAMLWDVDYHTTINYLCSFLRDFTADERAQYEITDSSPTCP